MIRSIALTGWLVCGALLIAPPVAAQDAAASEEERLAADSQLNERVSVLLAGIERVPTAEDWSAVGPNAVPVLIGIVNDTNVKVLTRGRAAIGLGYFATAESAAALRALLASRSTPPLLLRKSMVSLAKIEGDRSLDAIAVHLEHRTKLVREEAIRAVGTIGGADARARLVARKDAEPSKYLRELIATELEKQDAP